MVPILTQYNTDLSIYLNPHICLNDGYMKLPANTVGGALADGLCRNLLEITHRKLEALEIQEAGIITPAKLLFNRWAAAFSTLGGLAAMNTERIFGAMGRHAATRFLVCVDQSKQVIYRIMNGAKHIYNGDRLPFVLRNDGIWRLGHSSTSTRHMNIISNEGRDLIMAAGEMFVSNGTITRLTVQTGTFMREMSPERLYRAVLYFEKLGLDMSRVSIQLWDTVNNKLADPITMQAFKSMFQNL